MIATRCSAKGHRELRPSWDSGAPSAAPYVCLRRLGEATHGWPRERPQLSAVSDARSNRVDSATRNSISDDAARLCHRDARDALLAQSSTEAGDHWLARLARPPDFGGPGERSGKGVARCPWLGEPAGCLVEKERLGWVEVACAAAAVPIESARDGVNQAAARVRKHTRRTGRARRTSEDQIAGYSRDRCAEDHGGGKPVRRSSAASDWLVGLRATRGWARRPTCRTLAMIDGLAIRGTWCLEPAVAEAQTRRARTARAFRERTGLDGLLVATRRSIVFGDRARDAHARRAAAMQAASAVLGEWPLARHSRGPRTSAMAERPQRPCLSD